MGQGLGKEKVFDKEKGFPPHPHLAYLLFQLLTFCTEPMKMVDYL
jgi:hypothetical protein